MGQLDGQVALIAGGGRGMGREIALAFAQAGAKVAIAELDEEAAAETVAEIQALGGEALAIDCDGSTRFQVGTAVDASAHAFGRIDILVTTTQSPPPGTPFLRLNEDELEFAWSIGLLSTFRFMKACFPYLQQSSGTVLNLCTGEEGHAGAAALQGAICGLTQAAVLEWAEYSISLHCLCPGKEHVGVGQEAVRLVNALPVHAKGAGT